MNEPWSLLALAAVAIGWLVYLALIPREKVPKRPWAFAMWMLSATLLSLGSLGSQLTGHASLSPFGVLVTGLTVSLSAFFFFLLAQAPLPDGSIRCAVGDPLPTFEAMTSDGSPFRSDELRGGPALLKFFRGHW